MEGSAERPPLALLEVLDRAAQVLAQACGLEGRCSYEVITDEDGRVAEIWPHSKPGKLKRDDLDKLVIPVAPSS